MTYIFKSRSITELMFKSFSALRTFPNFPFHRAPYWCTGSSQDVIYICNIFGSENVEKPSASLFGQEILFSLKYTDGIQKGLENDTEN
jgi:hypothetical protein